MINQVKIFNAETESKLSERVNDFLRLLPEAHWLKDIAFQATYDQELTHATFYALVTYTQPLGSR